MLKAFVKSLEGVPENLREFYEQSEDGYVLAVDGSEYRKKISEFRENNIQWRKDREDLQNQLKNFDGIDPKKYAEMRKQLESLNEQGLLESGKIDELVNGRVSKIKGELEDQITKLAEGRAAAEKQAASYKSKLDDLSINDLIARAVSDVGKVQKGAMGDILSRARQVWRINENGVAVAMDGETKLYGRDGKDYLTPEEWGRQLMQDAPFLFEGNSGGSAPGSGGGPPSGGGEGVKIVPRSEMFKHAKDIAAGKAKIASE